MTDALLAAALDELRATDSALADALADSVDRAPGAIRDAAAELRARALERIALLDGFLGKLLEVERLEEQRCRYDLAARRAALEAAFAEDTAEGERQWFHALACSLVAGRHGFSLGILDLAESRSPRCAEASRHVGEALTEMRRRRAREAADAFERVTEVVEDRELAAAAAVEVGILYRDELQPKVLEIAWFERARRLWPEQPRIATAIGEHLRRLGALDEATRYFELAVGQDAEEAAGHIGLGLVAENRGWWSDALIHLARAARILAVDVDPIDAASGSRMASSGRLFLELAEVGNSSSDDGLVVAAATRAIELGVLGAGTHLESRAYHLRALAHERQGRAADAAKDLGEYGRKLDWARETGAAEEVLRDAWARSKDATVGWQLADVLRQRAYPVASQEQVQRLEESLRLWDEVSIATTPDDARWWAHIVRALTCEGLVESPLPTSRHAWEALFQGEQALAFRNSAANLGHLGRFLRIARIHVGEDEVTARALELDRNQETLLSRVITLTNLEQIDAARALISEVEDTPLKRAIAGFLQVRAGEAKPGAETLAAAIRDTPDPQTWMFLAHAKALRILGRDSESTQICAGLLDKPEFNQLAEMGRFAIAAFFARRPERSLELTTRMREDPLSDDEDARLFQGLSLLALGRVEEGRAALREVPTRLWSRGQVKAVDDMLTSELGPFLSAWPPEASVAVADLRRDLVARAESLVSPRTVRDELDFALAEPVLPELAEARAAAILAVRHRIDLQDGHLDAAADSFGALKALPGRRAAVAALAERLDEAALRADPGTEAWAVTWMQRWDRESEPVRGARWCARLAVARARQGDIVGAAESLTEAVERHAAFHSDRWAATVDACGGAIKSPSDAYASVDAARLVVSQLGPYLASGLSSWIDRYLGLPAGQPPPPLVAPLTVEVPSWLVGGALADRLVAMSEKLGRELGLRLPKPSTIGRPGSSCNVRINERLSGSVSLLPPDDEAARDQIVEATEAAIRGRAASFVVPDDTVRIVEGWLAATDAVPQVGAKLATSEAFACLDRLIRMLAAERLPVTLWRELLDAIARGTSGPFYELVASARGPLVANWYARAQRADTARVAYLDTDTESLIRAGVHKNASQTYFAASTDLVNTALAGIKKIVTDFNANVLVTGPEARRAVTKLAEYELPTIRVVSRNEIEHTT